MATFHSGSEGQTQKLQALRRRQKRLAFRAVIVPPVCWGICAASAPWWFPPLKETLEVRFDAQTQGWILLVLMLLMISLPVLISLHLKRRALGTVDAAEQDRGRRLVLKREVRGDARFLRHPRRRGRPRAAQPTAGARAPVSEPHRPRGESQRMRFGGAVPPRGNGHRGEKSRWDGHGRFIRP